MIYNNKPSNLHSDNNSSTTGNTPGANTVRNDNSTSRKVIMRQICEM